MQALDAKARLRNRRIWQICNILVGSLALGIASFLLGFYLIDKVDFLLDFALYFPFLMSGFGLVLGSPVGYYLGLWISKVADRKDPLNFPVTLFFAILISAGSWISFVVIAYWLTPFHPFLVE